MNFFFSKNYFKFISKFFRKHKKLRKIIKKKKKFLFVNLILYDPIKRNESGCKKKNFFLDINLIISEVKAKNNFFPILPFNYERKKK